MQKDELYNLLKEGESEHLAFRLFFGFEIIETLTAFANTQGGALLIGISELKEIKGVLDAKENIDQWFNETHTRTTPRLSPHIELLEIDNKTIVYISVAEYPVKLNIYLFSRVFGGQLKFFSVIAHLCGYITVADAVPVDFHVV